MMAGSSSKFFEMRRKEVVLYKEPHYQNFDFNRVWQIGRCMFMSGSNNTEAAVLKDVIATGKR